MITFTAIVFSVLLISAKICVFESGHGAIANLDVLRRIFLSVVIQSPRGHFRRRSAHHADDHVAVPRPGVLAVKRAGPRRMIGMRMIPAEDFQAPLTGRFFALPTPLPGTPQTLPRRLTS